MSDLQIIISLIRWAAYTNLLPIRYLKPKQALLLYTDRTERVSKNLERPIESGTSVEPLSVEPYDIRAITGEMNHVIRSGTGKETLCHKVLLTPWS